MCSSDSSVSIGLSSTSSFVETDIVVVVQQVLSRTSTTLLSPQLTILGFFTLHICCNNMASNASQSSNKKPLAHSISIYTANGTYLLVIKEQSPPIFILCDTYHIPKLSLNLHCVGQFCELGVNVLFTKLGVD